ncbi:TIGR03086 family metal-binding protein [Actinoplanes sp. NPDC051513]|uniref:TIGR03086 family metal-binding protein n=1 Tax=Actinoplanes sp. NPDC051513 TaxID=3363908 RepID=UPI00379BAD6A
MTTNLIALDALAVRSTVELVADLTPADLSLPTPCAGWDLGALLAHMTAQHRGFAAAASGHGGDLAAWSSKPYSVRDYAASADLVLSAFAAPGVLDRTFELPEFGASFPGRLAIGFHLVDYVVHGWDVAVSLGRPYAPDPAVLAATLPLARSVPDDASRLAPGAAFAPALPVPADADPLSEILLRLGRKLSVGADTKDA